MPSINKVAGATDRARYLVLTSRLFFPFVSYPSRSYLLTLSYVSRDYLPTASLPIRTPCPFSVTGVLCFMKRNLSCYCINGRPFVIGLGCRAPEDIIIISVPVLPFQCSFFNLKSVQWLHPPGFLNPLPCIRKIHDDVEVFPIPKLIWELE